MQGIFVQGERPRSKKQIREMVATDPARVHIEATSLFGNEYGYRRRNFYGQLIHTTDGRFIVK